MATQHLGRSSAQDLFFPPPLFFFLFFCIFFFIYSFLLFLLSERLYPLRLIVASDVLVQTASMKEMEIGQEYRDHLVHTRTHIRRENTHTKSWGPTTLLLNYPEDIQSIRISVSRPTGIAFNRASPPRPIATPGPRPSEDSANYPSRRDIKSSGLPNYYSESTDDSHFNRIQRNWDVITAIALPG